MDERVEDVDGRHDPCRERDFLPGKAARIAAAVEAFVVAASDLGAVGEVALAADQGGGLFEDELAVAGVFLHDLALFRGVLAGLEQDVIRRGDLAHIVQDGCSADHGAEGLGDDAGEFPLMDEFGH